MAVGWKPRIPAIPLGLQTLGRYPINSRPPASLPYPPLGEFSPNPPPPPVPQPRWGYPLLLARTRGGGERRRGGIEAKGRRKPEVAAAVVAAEWPFVKKKKEEGRRRGEEDRARAAAWMSPAEDPEPRVPGAMTPPAPQELRCRRQPEPEPSPPGRRGAGATQAKAVDALKPGAPHDATATYLLCFPYLKPNRRHSYSCFATVSALSSFTVTRRAPHPALDASLRAVGENRAKPVVTELCSELVASHRGRSCANLRVMPYACSFRCRRYARLPRCPSPCPDLVAVCRSTVLPP